MAKILESTESAYFSCFSTMFKNVVSGKAFNWVWACDPYIFIIYYDKLGNFIETSGRMYYILFSDKTKSIIRRETLSIIFLSN